ncbi:hypothetical protein GCM10027598_27300 [Amycolatopsis oliviviridis]|uniref:Type II toxin-antitoxin system HicA family toxin n=1 Tax=Amycolatopsis oliviviridis TaxID=1471590 RepID=A0ABQ3LIY3_9PSEU|nr:hypothetical protein GCM10017790_34950 [Amycolatopsis oliviviridis]
MGTRYHDKPELNEVIKELVEEHDWTIRPGGHGFVLMCPCGYDSISVPHTPPNVGNAARRLRRRADLCPDRHANTPRPLPKGRSS